jgi:malonate decarboxylase gamma subunit
MTLDEALNALFGAAYTVDVRPDGTLFGEARLSSSQAVSLLGVVNEMPLGVEGALALAHRVLALIRSGERVPIVMLIDSGSQRMSRRDELLGINEYLAHLAKALWFADASGIFTLTVLYGGGAAGAFVATALATRALVALPDAHPAVMDLPSIARVTKLPLEQLQRMSASTPVFAPGLANMQRMGAVTEIWEVGEGIAAQLPGLLKQLSELPIDERDRLGAMRGGRMKAAAIAEQVMREARRRD